MATRREAELFEPLDAIYESAFDPGRWADALRATVALHGSESFVAVSAAYRDARRGPFDADARDLHDWIGRHARRAFELGALLAREQRRSLALLERLPCAAFVCEADGRVVLRNQQGEALLRSGSGLRACRERLRTERPEDQRALDAALAAATRSAAGASLAGGSTLPVRRSSAAAPLAVHVDPLPPAESAAETFAECFVQPGALVLASDPLERAPIPEHALAAAFGLTPAEARMLAALAAGETPAEYAERRGITRETVRFYVKQLLAKTGTRRQADLVGRALESVARLAAPSPATAAPGRDD